MLDSEICEYFRSETEMKRNKAPKLPIIYLRKINVKTAPQHAQSLAAASGSHCDKDKPTTGSNDERQLPQITLRLDKTNFSLWNNFSRFPYRSSSVGHIKLSPNSLQQRAELVRLTHASAGTGLTNPY